MNVIHLLVSISRQSGGLYQSVRGLTRALHSVPDVTVHIHGISDCHTAQDLPAWQPLQPIPHSCFGPRAWAYAPTLAPALLSTPTDLLHSHALWQYPSYLAGQWHQKNRRPHIVSPRGALDPWAMARARWKKSLALWLFEHKHLHHATCLHALGQSEIQSIRRLGLTNPIALIPNGVDLPDLSPLPPATSGPRTLLYLGRLHPKKGLIPLLHAWADFQKSAPSPSSPDWQLVIAGWDQNGHEHQLRELTHHLGLDATVHFHGPAHGPDKDLLFRRADAFILPSFSEGLPMAVLEAWAYGLPVLMTDACNLPEGFSHHAALRLEIKQNSLHGLYPLLDLNHHGLRTIGQRGRRLVESRFTWPAIARQMHQVYQWLLGGGPAPDCIHHAPSQ